MRGRYSALSILAAVAGVAGGVYLERLYLNPGDTPESTGAEILYWVAPMDPNFRQPAPGKSPMGMDLIPVYAGQEPSGDPVEVSLSAQEINAIGVRTALAKTSEISQRIETVGFVAYDEHLTSHVHTRVDGWIEELNVRAVGDQVRKGELLFEMFSPIIGSSSADLVRALEDDEPRIIDAARNALRSQGMSDTQIVEIEESRQSARNLKVLAPQDGVVISLGAADGMFVQPGTRAVSLTDTSAVWLIVDVFERDIARMSDDMRAVARFEHLHGRSFEGEVDYVYPELDPKTRTLPVRLKFDNGEGLLRPNMFGNVSLIPQVTRMALTIPTEALIRTGSAERVILKTGEGTFKPRLVTTGLRDNFGEGGRTEVLQGLAPGEEVVASAQFLIDSESALNAGLMRMAPTDETPARGTGVLVALDRDTRVATIQHAALESLDWPEMTTRFSVRAGVALERLTSGQEVAFLAARGADGSLWLIELGDDSGVAATGYGKVMAVTSDGKLTLAHDPIPDLGWPAMEMDMPVAGFDPEDVPLDARIEFDLSKGEDGMFTIVAVRSETMADTASDADMTEASSVAVSGIIDTVNIDTQMATITHGPIAEIGMPGMTMDFRIAEALDLAALATGIEMTLTFTRSDGMTMVLTDAVPETQPMAVTGTINAVDQDAGTANITHGPMTQIGMPGMTMDFALDPKVDAAALPVGQELMLQLRQNADFSLTLMGVMQTEGTTQ